MSRTYSPLSSQLSLLNSLLSQVHRERAATSRTYEGASVLGRGHALNWMIECSRITEIGLTEHCQKISV